MRNKTIIICITIWVLALSSIAYGEYSVNHAGALKNFMRKGDISAKYSLSKLKGKNGLYALGALENLKGEIQILNGAVYNTFVSRGKLVFDQTFTKKASLLVYMQVDQWLELPLPKTIKTRKQFDDYIVETAAKNGIDTQQPFPFLLTGKAKEISWHVINWDPKDMKHTHRKHIESGPNGTLKNTEVDIIGVYSNKHTAIFTHHTTDTHMHFITADKKLAGHIDRLITGGQLALKLPK